MKRKGPSQKRTNTGVKIEVLPYSARQVRLLAFLQDRPVGRIVLRRSINFPWRRSLKAALYITSHEAGQGIPRALFERATETIQKWANKTGKEITHKGFFLTANAASKLAHLYEEQGYRPIIANRNRAYIRTYKPEK